MDPMNAAILAGSAQGSGTTPDPSRVATLTSEAERNAAEAADVLERLQLSLAQRAAGEARSAVDGINNSIGSIAKEAVRRGNLGGKTAKKVVDKLDMLAEDELNATRRVVNGIGGTLPVLLEDTLAIQMSGEYESQAVEMILAPIVERRLQAEKEAHEAGITAPGFDPIVGIDLPPVTEPAPTFPYPEPPIPIPGLDPIPVPLPIPGEPEVPVDPDPTVPPTVPYPPPSPVDPGTCCPPSYIVVPAPVVNVYPPGSTPTPCSPSPPTISPPTTSPPPPPEEPEEPEEPTDPSKPKPKPPPPFVIDGYKGTDPTGAYDGPLFCANLHAVVSKIDHMDGLDSKAWITNAGFQVANSLGGIPVVGEIAKGLGQVAVAFASAVFDTGATAASAIGITNPGSALWDIGLTAVPALVEKWAGVDMSYYTEPIKQVAHTLNPVYLLSQNEADQAYLSGMVDEKQWRCYTLAEGNLPWHHWQAMFGNRRRPGVTEIVALRLRKAISEDEFYARMRNEGVLTKSEAYDYLQLGTQLPTITDLMTWMRKDVANEAYVAFAGLDEGFAQSWTPELQGLAEAVGATNTQIKYEYRAQWQDIPLTQIYQMFWRLRPGRVDPSLAFTKQNAIDLMKIQEVPPNFRNRILEVAYLPINRTDLLAAHKAGVVDDKGVFEGFQDLGYSPKDAALLRDMTVVKSRRESTAAMGAWTQRKTIKEYIAGNITGQQADDLLSRTITDPKIRKQALEDADTIREAQGKSKCIASIKRRYLVGEFDDNQADTILTRLKVEPLVVQQMLTQWACERTSRRKEPTVAMLVEWTSQGIITEVELLRRLMNLGYSKDDAIRIGLAEKNKDGEKKSKKAEAAAEKRDRKRRQAHADADHNAKEHGGQKPGPL